MRAALLDVALAQRRGDPDRVAVVHQAGQRGHEAAAAAARLTVLEGGGAAVRHEDERGVRAHRRSRKIFSQSRSRRGVRKCLRTCSLPARPSRLPRSGSRSTRSERSAHSAGRGDEEAGLAVLHLQRDAAHVAADERAALPERLRHGQPEALARRLLDHHVGLRLERVHLDRPDVVQVVEDVDVGVAVRVGHRRVEELPALGVVGGHRADQGELHLGHLLRHLTVRVDHPHGSFQGSKRDTWHRSGRSTSMPNWSHTNAASSGDSAMFFGDSGSIAGGQMCTPALAPSMPAGT